MSPRDPSAGLSFLRINVVQVFPGARPVRAVELERAAERVRTGRRVLGRRSVLAQSWRDYPASVEPRRNLRPRVATRSNWARVEALLRNRVFVIEYASARERWQNGVPAVFPPGTYWLQRFASVPVLET